jgi:hypothetical protein
MAVLRIDALTELALRAEQAATAHLPPRSLKRRIRAS